jgi:hypothetical protein
MPLLVVIDVPVALIAVSYFVDCFTYTYMRGLVTMLPALTLVMASFNMMQVAAMTFEDSLTPSSR